MILEYRSEHPNHVHQLAVSVSKHYYATKDGRLKYQQKPIELKLSDLAKSDKANLVHFVIRDHFSGLFYSEASFGRELTLIEQFLRRAWALKDDYVFGGLPRLLMIPRTVQAVFPRLAAQVTKLDINLVEVTSGFQTGVRDIRTIEQNLVLAIDGPIETAGRFLRHICVTQAEGKSRNRVDNKLELWAKYVPPLQILPAQWPADA